MTIGQESGARSSFLASHPYELDPFQLEALDSLDEGRSILVTAPTGAGKTVVAEYAVQLALKRGVRAFYTTPLKALSNQKFADLSRLHGPASVGLLTGDTSVNPDASVVVMTTEVLRNMIHSERTSLATLGYVVLDEVHFLEDRYRGGVWEEVILGAPKEVVLVCLSATVANAADLAEWIGQVRGETAIVSEGARPVELREIFAIGDRSSEGVQLLPTFVKGRPNPAAIQLDELMVRHGPRTARPKTRPPQGPRGRVRTYRPRRSEVVERLRDAELLPAIYFIFSRAGCDEAVRYCLDDGLRLTSVSERKEIRAIAESRTDALSDDDLSVLGYGRFIAGLEAGIAAHHAGMVPPFREAVEECFSRTLTKVVFATETLALGINMPARSVVIEELTKYSGAGHAELTPGEYTQLTGRAGRRGIDDVGYAVVLASPFHTFDDLARLAGAPGRPLTSSFRPTYNLAVSLVRRFDKPEAYRVVTSSFAQFLSEEDLGDQLTGVVEMLSSRGYLRGWDVTPAGEMLAGLYHEADLLVAEALRAGLLDGLEPAALAATVSSFCFEARREREGALEAPPGPIASAISAIEELSSGLGQQETELGLPVTRGVDPGFARLTRDWARGRDLRLVLMPEAQARKVRQPVSPNRRSRRSGPPEVVPRRASPVMTGGDFVRNTKQVIDLLRQLAVVAPQEATRASAGAGAKRLLRGVVEASSTVPLPTDGDVEDLEPESPTIHAPGEAGS